MKQSVSQRQHSLTIEPLAPRSSTLRSSPPIQWIPLALDSQTALQRAKFDYRMDTEQGRTTSER